MRDELTPEFTAEAEKDQHRPIELYDIYLGSQEAVDGETYFFCTDNTPLSFFDLEGNAQTYLPMRVKRSAVSISNQLEINLLNAEFDNVELAWNAWLAQVGFDLRGKKVVARLVYGDLLDDATHAKVIFDGFIDNLSELTEKSAQINLKSKIKPLDVESGIFQQLYCPWIFGDEFCGFSVPGTSLSGQVLDAGSTTTQIIDAARTEADDYWNDGVIEFTSGDNEGAKRKIVDFVAADDKLVLDFALPATPQAGDTYTIERGCDKTFARCQGFMNEANFGGMKHLPPLINPKL